MSILFDRRWTPDMLPEAQGGIERGQEFLSPERVATRVIRAMNRAWVFAAFEGLPNEKYVVKDVRMLCCTDAPDERVQVLILEGWRTPARLWTDEPELEIIETVQ
jgi:hypothetical protein